MAYTATDKATMAFIGLFIWRYLRQVVHLVSFWLYQPVKPVANPRITSRDVTVIIPTIDPTNGMFRDCLVSILKNNPVRVIIVTAGQGLRTQAADMLSGTTIDITAVAVASKRTQVATGLALVTSSIVALVDDHVVWPAAFLHFALPAFEDDRVGLVGTNKRVVREDHASIMAKFLNMIQCLYLERHNFEIRSSNAVDGGVFVVSGRTALVRAAVVVGRTFRRAYLNDHFFFGLLGPLGVDDDNFLTRWCVAHNWRIRIQYRPETLIVTELGSATKFAGGLRRWVRTTWRSNTTSLLHAHVWRAQPWCVYAVYLTSFTNFALFYDMGLFYAFSRSTIVAAHGHGAFVPLVLVMVAFKMVKPFAYFWRNPQDLLLLPGYFLFTWAHSFIKLWALVTFWDCAWSGRNLGEINDTVQAEKMHEE